MEFNIGDRVYALQHKQHGTVEDKLYSNKSDDYKYIVKFDGSDVYCRPLYANELEFEQGHYRYEVQPADNNVVVAVLYETIGGVEREIGRGHGHVMHAGAIGFAQAASYAMKKIYINMNDGKLLCYNKEEDIYE